MIDQQRRLREPLQTGPAARVAVSAAALLAVIGLGLGIALAGGGRSAAEGPCVAATVASTTGGAQVHACGAGARSLCAEPGQLAGNEQLARSCRAAGLPFGGPRG